MPKVKKSRNEFLFGVVNNSDFKNEFKTDVEFGQKVLFCIVCGSVVNVGDNRMSLVVQHRRNKEHVAKLEERRSQTTPAATQELVTNFLIPIQDRHAEFHSDMTRAFVAGKFSSYF